MNKDDLITAFRAIGLREGMTLEVHSSLSSFGQVEGGAQSVIDALISCVGQAGSIFMPALRLSRDAALTEEDRRLGITRKLKILPPDAERTGMGIIADTFRRRADTVTGEGVFRTCGWGLQAGQAVTGGLDHAIRHGGKALMLGVDIDTDSKRKRIVASVLLPLCFVLLGTEMSAAGGGVSESEVQ